MLGARLAQARLERGQGAELTCPERLGSYSDPRDTTAEI